MESGKQLSRSLKPAAKIAGFKSIGPSSASEYVYLSNQHPLTISSVSRTAFRKSLLQWYDRVCAPHPWRLDFSRTRDPYRVWVSEIMLQQTVIKAVLPVYKRFMEQFPDVYALAAGGEAAVRQAVRGLGYYRRFSFLHKAAKELVDHHTDDCGRVIWPTAFESWKALPGIGDYTAAAISSICYDYPAAVIDGNVERVFCRLFDLQYPANAPFLKKEFKKFAPQLLATSRPGDYNQALMELGQTVCTLASPSCSVCPVNRTCLARQRQTQKFAPQLKTRQEFVDVKLNMYVFFQGKKVLLWRRPEQAKFLKQSFGFLTLFAPDKDGSLCGDGFDVGTSFQKCQFEKIATVKHTITKHRLNIQVFRTEVSTKHPMKDIANLPMELVSPKLVEAELVANLDRKAGHALLSDLPVK